MNELASYVMLRAMGEAGDCRVAVARVTDGGTVRKRKDSKGLVYAVPDSSATWNIKHGTISGRLKRSSGNGQAKKGERERKGDY